MTQRVLRPTGMGFLLLDSHPDGCARVVDEMITEAGPPASDRAAAEQAGPRTLVLGCSSGYGLAAAVAGIYRHGASVIGLCFERPATARRSATGGWYRTGALAARAGARFRPVSGDCFDPAVRAAVLDQAAAAFGQIDVLIYSVAAPRRTDPVTGEIYQSAVKPIGAGYRARNLAFPDGRPPELREAELEPADPAEITSTVKVMGGEDWASWVTDLAGRGMLAPGFRTVALTYLGSELTAPVYRHGTIGRAKDHLESTAGELTSGVLAGSGATAVTSVNCAAVTQSSLAIPGISLYLSLLHQVAGDRMESEVRQSVRLWDHLTGRSPAVADDQGRLRLDDWELDPAVQARLRELWTAPDGAVLAQLTDPGWFRERLLRLYGFGVSGVDYDQATEVDLAWPA